MTTTEGDVSISSLDEVEEMATRQFELEEKINDRVDLSDETDTETETDYSFDFRRNSPERGTRYADVIHVKESSRTDSIILEVSISDETVEFAIPFPEDPLNTNTYLNRLCHHTGTPVTQFADIDTVPVFHDGEQWQLAIRPHYDQKQVEIVMPSGGTVTKTVPSGWQIYDALSFNIAYYLCKTPLFRVSKPDEMPRETENIYSNPGIIAILCMFGSILTSVAGYTYLGISSSVSLGVWMVSLMFFMFMIMISIRGGNADYIESLGTS